MADRLLRALLHVFVLQNIRTIWWEWITLQTSINLILKAIKCNMNWAIKDRFESDTIQSGRLFMIAECGLHNRISTTETTVIKGPLNGNGWSPHTVVLRPIAMLSCELAEEISCQISGIYQKSKCWEGGGSVQIWVRKLICTFRKKYFLWRTKTFGFESGAPLPKTIHRIL